jgi:hypothetical protein
MTPSGSDAFTPRRLPSWQRYRVEQRPLDHAWNAARLNLLSPVWR